MKFLRPCKYLIAFALLFAVAAAVVSVAATSDDASVSSGNTDAYDMKNTEMTSDDLPVSMDENGNTYIELDKVNITFNIDAERTVENVMKAAAAKAEEITEKYDLIKFTVDSDKENSYEYVLAFRLPSPPFYDLMDCEIECPDEVEYSAPQGHHKVIIRSIYHFTINVKDNPDKHEYIRFLVFNYFMLSEYSGSITSTWHWYDDEISLQYTGGMFLCTEYREYGYDNIADYYVDVRNGKAPAPQNAYLIVDKTGMDVRKFTDKYRANTELNREQTSIYEDIFGK